MPSPGMEPLTTILTTFSRAHPDVTVNAEAAFTPEEVLALVRTGSAEIGILGSAQPTRAADLDVDLAGTSSPRADLGTRRRRTNRRQHFARRPHRMPTHRLPTRIADARTRRRRPRQRNRSQHRRRNRPPHIDFADGPQRSGTCRHARIVDRTARRSGARVQTITPETYLHVAAVSRRNHLTTPATALMIEAQRLRSASSPPNIGPARSSSAASLRTLTVRAG